MAVFVKSRITKGSSDVWNLFLDVGFHTFYFSLYVKLLILQLRIDGYKWSSAFSVSSEGEMRVHLQRDNGNDKIQLKVEVRSGTKSSRYEVLFRPNSFLSPYRSSLVLLDNSRYL